MTREETWAVPIQRARHFFDSQPDVQPREAGYAFGCCCITLTELSPGRMGKIPFSRTLLRIEGPEKEVSMIHRRFLIQFLTAGG